MREAHICVHGVGLRGGYSTWHAEASIGIVMQSTQLRKRCLHYGQDVFN